MNQDAADRVTETQSAHNPSASGDAYPVVPSTLAAYFDRPPESSLRLLIATERSRLCDILEEDLRRLSTEERDALEELIKRRLARVLIHDEIRLPVIPPIMISRAVESSNNRTKNAMMRLYGQKPLLEATVSVTSVRELLGARNFGLTCALDFLRQLDRLPNYEILIAERDELLRSQLEPPTDVMKSLAPDVSLASPAISLLEMLTLKDLRHVSIVMQRLFNDHGRTPTLQELAIPLGVTRERVRQIEFMQTRRIRGTLALPRYRCLRSALHSIRERAGFVASCEFGSLVVHEALGVPAGETLPQDVLIFALFLAGYGQRDMSWIYYGTRAAVIEQIDAVIVASADGNKSLNTIIEMAAEACAVPERFIRETIDEYNITVVAEFAFPRLLNAQDRVEALFRVTKKPMSLDVIAEILGQDSATKASLQNQLGGDPRFYRVNVSQYALAEWEIPKYTTITNAIREEVVAQGGGVSLALLMRELPRKFGVSATSVQMYAAQRPFVIDAYGIVKIAESNRTMPRRELPSPQQVRNLFRVKGVWHVRVQVTSEMLRGVGITTSIVAADLAGVKQGDMHLKQMGESEVSFRWTSQQPYISSIRYFLETSTLSIGDYVFLSLTPEAIMHVFAIRSHIVEESVGLKRLAALCGVLDDTLETEPLQRIASAIGLDTADAKLAAVREIFVARRDQEALELLPGSGNHVDYDPLDDLMALLE